MFQLSTNKSIGIRKFGVSAWETPHKKLKKNLVLQFWKKYIYISW